MQIRNLCSVNNCFWSLSHSTFWVFPPHTGICKGLCPFPHELCIYPFLQCSLAPVGNLFNAGNPEVN